ncbi:FkbM family methyltransferase [Quadrisphaera sp. DSM 44207]|uniref:FkbM family methyltransferase n=1 Tax=Quadrisphaera sp. DSM 44207 TaxID=1881057 RepID=UPI0008884F77|nr:FkbM family methyltransferase [Quadrisphaera sp. DSM 44207]SDQ48495.1 methyltransferase, FkbM family [Quadrisphaera sp. DSM 44207]
MTLQGSATEAGADFRSSTRSRRQTWFGAKRFVKAAVSVPGVNRVVRRAVPLVRPGARPERLPVPLTVRRVTARMAGVEFVMLGPSRDVVAKELHWGGGRRPGAADQLALDVFAALARDADTVLDVGAYTGVFSLLGARVAPAADVHAFEVVPGNAAAAQANVVANDLLRSITVHVAAVGAVGADGGAVVVPTGRGGSALPDYWSTAMHFERGVHVPVRSLDSLLPQLDPQGRGRRAVVKVDVEGAEDAVLLGGRELLRRWRPDVLCELLPAQAKVPAVLQALDGLGYRWFLVQDAELVEHPVPRGDERFRDWLLTPRTDEQLRAAGVPARALPARPSSPAAAPAEPPRP